MGIYDRDYYQGEQAPGIQLGGQWSMIGKLIAINVAVFVADVFATGNLSDWMAASGTTLTEPWKLWQLVTYGFAHSNTHAFHIVGNMLGLFFFGREMERVYGPKEFLRFYLVAMVLGGLVFAARALGTGGHVVGASGAVAATVILFVFHYPKRTVLLMFFLPVPAWVLGVLLIGNDVLGSIGDGQQIAFDVHLVGAAFAITYFKFRWNLGRLTPNLTGSKRWIRPKPKLKIHEPVAEDPYRSLDAQADVLLAKVKVEGVASLTDKEHRLLEDYSRRMRRKHS
jgi:membrane associated rhomboid family serine protease